MKETEHSQDNYLEDIKTHFMNTIWEQQTDYERAESKLIELIERYATAKAKARCEATLIKASDNAKLIEFSPCTNFVCMKAIECDHPCEESEMKIDKSSITDPLNIVIL